MILLPIIGGVLVAGSIGLSVAVARKRLDPKDARRHMDRNQLLTLFLGQMSGLARWDSLKNKTPEQKRTAQARILIAATKSATMLGLLKTAAVLQSWIPVLQAGSTAVDEDALEELDEKWPGTDQTVWQYLKANMGNPTVQRGAV